MTIYQEIVCPHCGNEIIVKNEPKEQKCKWCRRVILVTFTKIKKNKWSCVAEPVEFTQDDVKVHKKKDLNKWKDEDIYGIRKG